MSMQVVRKRKFFGERGSGTGRSFSDLLVDDCVFHWCVLSQTVEPDKLAQVRNVQVCNCRLLHPVAIGPSVIRNVTVENIETQTELVCWHPLLQHVTLRGRIGRIKIETYPCVEARYFKPEPLLRAFEKANAQYYSEVDWALDIREAHAEMLDIQGVPWHLIRRDRETQLFIDRRVADDPHWCEHIRADNHWIDYVEERFMNPDIDKLLLVAPKALPQAEYERILSDLHELRQAGKTTAE